MGARESHVLDGFGRVSIVCLTLTPFLSLLIREYNAKFLFKKDGKRTPKTILDDTTNKSSTTALSPLI